MTRLPKLKCPQCGTVIDAPGPGTATCTSCGFSAPVGQQEEAVPPAPGDAAPTFAASGQQATPPGQPAAYAAPPGQVPASQVLGKPRGFWTSFFLGLITIGIYYLVWNYKAFRELDKQHGRDHEQVWFWLLFVPYIGTIFFLVYLGKETGKVNEYRQQRGMQDGVSPAAMIVLYLLGILTLGITTIVAYYKLTKSQNEIWWDVYQKAGKPWPLST